MLDDCVTSVVFGGIPFTGLRQHTNYTWAGVKYVFFIYKYTLQDLFKYKYKYKYGFLNYFKYKYKYEVSNTNTNTTQKSKVNYLGISKIKVTCMLLP